MGQLRAEKGGQFGADSPVGGEDMELHEGLRFLHFGKYLPFLA